MQEQVKQWLTENEELMQLLTIVEKLNLPDCWISAGTIRNYLWNRLEGRNELDVRDIDVVYFDQNSPYELALEIEAALKKDYPMYQWEVRNQAHMHQHNFEDEKPYTSTFDAISKYPEICTAIAARKQGGAIELLAPFGLTDIFNFTVQATPHFKQNAVYFQLYLTRQKQKNWSATWSQLKMINKITKSYYSQQT